MSWEIVIWPLKVIKVRGIQSQNLGSTLMARVINLNHFWDISGLTKIKKAVVRKLKLTRIKRKSNHKMQRLLIGSITRSKTPSNKRRRSNANKWAPNPTPNMFLEACSDKIISMRDSNTKKCLTTWREKIARERFKTSIYSRSSLRNPSRSATVNKSQIKRVRTC